jgi:type III restriction enzyme
VRDTSRFKNEDLVLKVTSNIDPTKFDITMYEPFLDSLCVTREYQKTAIRTVCNYLFGGAYQNQRALAEENYNANGTLQEKYATFPLFERALEFPDQLACSVDLATGTGKSYVIYGIARIALAAGVVDRVLVICPSNTIEAGLLDKFHAESKLADHTAVLPEDSAVRSPHVIDATETATVGSICVENRHAMYAGAKSAIEDSYKGKGDRTLVLCDEAHHIYTPEQEGLKKWKEFLLSADYGFRYIAGFSGTCYLGNDYFPDVVARYSLAQATKDGVVKEVDYVAEDGSNDPNERLQLIYANHEDNRKKYKLVKPLTIVVTKDIPGCKRMTDQLIDFIANEESIPKEQAAQRVMRVHTKRASGQPAKEDASIPANLSRLRSGEPDRKESPVEWITSVSMLTEGWDVKNVFQIVPHEERAFNSKLLIAQVLGRGLRIPPEYAGQQPVVIVFNHASWSGKIKELVKEVLERDRRVLSSVMVKQPKDYDFTFHHIDYSKAQDVVETEQVSEYNFDKPFVNLAAQRATLDRQTVYERALSVQRRSKTTRVRTEMYPADQVVNDIHNKFRAIDLEEGTEYANRYPKERIEALVKASLDHIGYVGNEVSKENKQRLLSSFGNLKRPGNKSIRYRLQATAIREMRASHRGSDSVGTVMLRRGSTIFYDDISKTVDPELTHTLGELEEDLTLPRSALHKVQNTFMFKTCLSVALTNGEPERKFVAKLVQPENAAKIDAWFKNTDQGFYEIEYSYPKTGYSKRSKFNPDFFICIENNIVVVEIKDEEEKRHPSPENKGKKWAADEHFTLLNQLQQDKRYHFCSLDPDAYDLFFAELRDGKVMTFQSSLDVELLK